MIVNRIGVHYCGDSMGQAHQVFGTQAGFDYQRTTKRVQMMSLRQMRLQIRPPQAR